MLLLRYGSTPMGTFGQLNTDPIIYTVERPWADNKPFVSCIPAGRYTLAPHTSQKYGATYALEGRTVSQFKSDKARYGILFHPGNIYIDLQGCIAPGLKLGMVYKDQRKPPYWAVQDSLPAHQMLLDQLKAGDILEVRWNIITDQESGPHA